MKTEPHPLTEYLKRSGESLTSFSSRVGMSRVHLYRIIRGANTSTDKIKAITDATNGDVPVSAFFGERAGAQ
jgi:hypothetical protein